MVKGILDIKIFLKLEKEHFTLIYKVHMEYT